MAATRFRSAAGGSTTIEVEDIEVETLSRAEDTSSARLLVNLDTSNRTEAELIANTIRELLEVASREDAHSVRDMVKNAIVIAFKRRNHKKSMADGEGPGEKRIFLEILIAIIGMERFDDLVMAVLPLIPIYGSWRDLAMLAEMLIAKSMTTVEDDVPSSPIVKAICEIFAKQIMEDDQHLESEPSNACKYCPHEGRHRTKKRKADAMEVRRRY